MKARAIGRPAYSPVQGFGITCRNVGVPSCVCIRTRNVSTACKELSLLRFAMMEVANSRGWVVRRDTRALPEEAAMTTGSIVAILEQKEGSQVPGSLRLQVLRASSRLLAIIVIAYKRDRENQHIIQRTSPADRVRTSWDETNRKTV